MSYLASSLATSAVLLSGLSAVGLSSSVRTFHVPKVIGVTLYLFLLSLFRPQNWETRQPRLTSQVVVKQAIFGAPFLARSSCYGGEQCIPEEGCSVAQIDAGFHCCFGQ